MDFLEDGSDNEPELALYDLSINESYAKAFAYKKEREELSQLKDRYGSDYENLKLEDDESSESESEDEDGEELTPAVDAAILRTLSRIRKRDPAIYDTAQSVFEEEAQRTAASTPWGFKVVKDKSKPLTIKEQNMQALLNGNARSRSPSPSRPTHVQEQHDLRNETINAFHEAVSDGEDQDDGDLLTLREKTQDELQKEEEEYRTYLERAVGDVKSLVQIEETQIASTSAAAEPSPISTDNVKKKSKKDRKGRKQESDQEFLMNYILNRGWIDRETRHLPTYTEITGRAEGSLLKPEAGPSASKSNGKAIKVDIVGVNDEAKGDEEPALEDLEEFEDVADVFESTYNFRFEEPGASTIQGHPRQIQTTVRREENPRKEARERRKARKAEEIAKKTEEVNRLKALRMREIRRKLYLVEKESGLKEEDLQELDLDGEWEASKHDTQMAALYAEDQDLDNEDVTKPVWDDDIDVGDIIASARPEPATASEKKSKKQKKKEERRRVKAANAAAENDGGVDIDAMDAEADVEHAGISQDDEEWDGTEEMRKRKLNEYMEELYGLEFNDIIGGDIATRFKYTPVEPSSFQLTPAEILLATDAELNDYVGLKRFAPYRQSRSGKTRDQWDSKRGEKLKAIRQALSHRTGGSNWGGGASAGMEQSSETKKRKGKKERQKAKLATGAGDASESTHGANGVSDPAVVGQKRRHGHDSAEDQAEGITKSADARAKKRRRKKSAQEAEL